jgi:DNA-binding NtrC family response regulator
MADPKRIRILIVDDDEDFRSLVVGRVHRRGNDVEGTGQPGEALRRAQEKRFDVAVLDLALPEMDGTQLLERLRQVDPDTQTIMLTGQGTIETAIRAMKLGAYDYLTKPCRLAELELHVERAYAKARLAQENQALKAVIRRSEPEGEIVGTSPAIRQVLHLIRKVAPTDSSVLVLGESGTGKELVARALHRGSPRAERPLIVVNCAALQETLLESELFGHEKGAFTSAVAAKPGLLELADGGTLFIDEIGEMAGALQAKLLRVLEDGWFRRVGATREIHADVRVVAATNKDLSAQVSAGRFRDDLYYRLNVITIQLPPLRQRPNDIPALVRHFLQRGPRGPREIDADALHYLTQYRWPGNVRELANVLERAQILAERPTITLRDLPTEIVKPSAPTRGVEPFRTPPSDSTNLGAVECQHILHVLQSEGWNKARAARVLGVSRRRLYRLLEKHGLMNAAPGTAAEKPALH